ncbi:MAG: RNA-binding S4 domain-containing protein [Oscillospiraceae bacterium]|jgi:ribosomal 50S subunit-recycling heat shock protein|nr:RNA-binding S4 domain-containing protein [Oscillospiraceae bacterium]
MRLDKYLKVSRLVKRRTVANELCDARHVEVNGKAARASLEVKPDDEIAVQTGPHRLRVRVLAVNEFATKESACTMFEILEQT